MSKQILQLVMEDAIDDWLLRQIHWLRREETVAQGIRWVQDVSIEPKLYKHLEDIVCQLRKNKLLIQINSSETRLGCLWPD